MGFGSGSLIRLIQKMIMKHFLGDFKVLIQVQTLSDKSKENVDLKFNSLN